MGRPAKGVMKPFPSPQELHLSYVARTAFKKRAFLQKKHETSGKATVAKQLHWQRPVGPSPAAQAPAVAETPAAESPAVGSSASEQHP